MLCVCVCMCSFRHILLSCHNFSLYFFGVCVHVAMFSRFRIFCTVFLIIIWFESDVFVCSALCVLFCSAQINQPDLFLCVVASSDICFVIHNRLKCSFISVLIHPFVSSSFGRAVRSVFIIAVSIFSLVHFVHMFRSTRFPFIFCFFFNFLNCHCSCVFFCFCCRVVGFGKHGSGFGRVHVHSFVFIQLFVSFVCHFRFVKRCFSFIRLSSICLLLRVCTSTLLCNCLCVDACVF